MTIKRQSIMFLRPANPYDLDQRHNRPDKRGLLPFSHRLQPQPGKKLQPGKQPQPGKKNSTRSTNQNPQPYSKKTRPRQKEKPQQGK